MLYVLRLCIEKKMLFLCYEEDKVLSDQHVSIKTRAYNDNKLHAHKRSTIVLIGNSVTSAGHVPVCEIVDCLLFICKSIYKKNVYVRRMYQM